MFNQRKHNGLYAFVSQIKVMCSVIEEIFPFPFVFSFFIMRTHAAKKCNAKIWKKRFSWVTSHELHLDWIKHENWSLLKLIRSNIIKGSLSRQQFLSLFSWSPRKNVNSRQFFGVCVTPGCVTISTFIFMQKHQKWTAHLPLSAGCFLIAQAGLFVCCTTTVGLYWHIMMLLKFHVPSRDFFL